MKLFSYPAQNVLVDGNNILFITRDDERLSLVRMQHPSACCEKVASYQGLESLFLGKLQDTFFVSVDNVLLRSNDLLEWTPVLELRKGNTIWHMSETPWGLLAQEYGESPTSIYQSSNGSSWKVLVTNTQVDPTSRHFHSLAYDTYRDVAYATLGDANLVRLIVLQRNLLWRPLYSGPWQLVPILPQQDKVILGFDSAIAKGGILMYYPDTNTRKLMFCKWVDAMYEGHCMFSDMKSVDGLFLGALAAPQAIVVSKDLRLWNILHLSSYNEAYDFHTGLSVNKNLLAFTTGSSLGIAERTKLAEELRANRKGAMAPYGAHEDRLKSVGFAVKRIPDMLKCRVFMQLR